MQGITLTTSVDAVSGGAGDDTISGLIGASGTYTVGDNINGGAGTDTLNLIDGGSATATPLVSLAGVETVNVRMLTAGTTIVNANDWNGVTKVTNASSFAGSTLNVTGLSTTTQINAFGNADINVAFSNTTTAAAAISVALTSVGGDATATTMGSASAAATANIDLDYGTAGTGLGLMTAIAVDISGSKNLVNIEAGSNVKTYTITGTGNAFISTNDTITSFDASAAKGNLDVTLSGVSEVVAKGGDGNDTLRLGTTISNSDSFDGGAGTDTIAVTVGGFNRNLNTTSVEAATVTFTDSGELNASASTVATYNVSAGSAGVAATITQIVSEATVNLTNNDLGAVALDYASGAATTTINVGSATWSADVGLASLAVTDVASVTLNAVTGISAGATALITTATFDADVKAIVVQTLGGTGSFEIGNGGDASIGGATALTFNANGAANINFDSVIAGGATLTTLSVNTYGATAGSATLVGVGGTGITTINLNASGAADIEIGAVALGNGASAAGAIATINVTQGAEQDTTIGDISTTGGISLTINAPVIASSGSLVLNDLTIAQGSSTALAMGVTINAMTISTGASFEIDGIDLEGSATGAQVNIGTIVMESGASLDFGSASGISGSAANTDLGAITLTMGASATANFGNVSLTGGAVGAITVTLGEGATATFGTVTASAISTHSLVLSSGASASFGAIQAFSGGNANQGTVGAFEIAGVDGSDVSVGTIGASSVGAISVSGALDLTFGTITTTTIGEVNATGLGVSGTFTIDLSGVTNAVEVKLGAGTNTVISGAGNDVLTLLAGRTAVAGNDNIQYGTASQGNDNIINFIGGAAASGGDQVEFDVSAFGTGIKDADGSAIAAAESVVFGTASGAAVTLGASANIILFTTAYASTAALITDAAADITLATGTLRSGDFFAVWTDGTDTYVSQIHIEEGASATDGIIALASASGITVTTFATLSSVSAGALVAANFAFV